jgi:hypothetical protein
MTDTTSASRITEIAFILDRSGSMESIKQGTIEGYNSFISQQQENEKYPVRFSLTLFNTEIEEKITSVPVLNLTNLEEGNYLPSGGTALLDAIGITVDNLGKRLAAIPEAERPCKVIVAIMTDGEENSSRIFSWDEISEKIRRQTEVYKWEFLFMGADQDAIATASRMNIARDSSVKYYSTYGSTRSVIRAMGKSIKHSKMAPNQNAEKPSLSDLVAEEEAKEESEK